VTACRRDDVSACGRDGVSARGRVGVWARVRDRDTLGAANGWDLWDSWDLWGGLISPMSLIGPI
jgi:hypothetical protein